MKRWAIIITLTYALLWLMLAYPVTWVTLGFDWWHLDGYYTFTHEELFGEPFLWGLLITFLLCQAALLFIPVAVSKERPKARRHILWPMLAVTFLLANLLYWGVISLAVLVSGFETSFAPSIFLTDRMHEVIEQGMLSQWFGIQISISNGWYELAGFLLPVLAVWLIWALVFYKYFWRADEENWLRRWLRNLVRGSVLELLVVLPTHLAIRGKHDCCAPAVSFMGIVTGLSVMLMCFGPGVMFLYLDRARQMKEKRDPLKTLNSETR